jgi:hypothetical protein
MDRTRLHVPELAHVVIGAILVREPAEENVACGLGQPLPLSPSQSKAVTATGVQLILAGPGSGKTRVITEKILHLIHNGRKPENILALTFSDISAHEMLEQLQKQDKHKRSHHQPLPLPVCVG